MLSNLSITNFLLIKSATIDFRSGLCVITGETGAGKSIILDALIFVLGGKASAKSIRHGASQATITAEISIQGQELLCKKLEEHNIPVEDNILIRRTINLDGKSKNFINDIAVNLSTIKQIEQLILEIHGQNEQGGLLEAKAARQILDLYGKVNITPVKALYTSLQAARGERKKLLGQKQELEKEEEYLKHIIKELEEIAPEKGEEEILAEQRIIAQNKGKISELITSVLKELTEKNDVSKAIAAASRIISRTNIEAINLQPAHDALDRAAIEFEEALSYLNEQLKLSEDASLYNLDEIEQRLFQLRAMARKYNCAADSLPEYLADAQGKLSQLTSNASSIKQLDSKIVQLQEQYASQAQILSTEREQAARKLEAAILGELKMLKMENTRFKIDFVKQNEAEWSEFGWDKVSFLASTNPGSPFSPLADIASGGELSRFMLAAKVALSDVKSVPILVFDEVDTGIGGAVADAVGVRLALLGKAAQVIAITHQPQIAAKAGEHLFVSKKQGEHETETTVRELSRSERVEELARMLSGSHITHEARAAAEKLLG
jgi:DNA repair protein RecN (Recombination protein N)